MSYWQNPYRWQNPREMLTHHIVGRWTKVLKVKQYIPEDILHLIYEYVHISPLFACVENKKILLG